MPFKDPETARAWRKKHQPHANKRRRERYAIETDYRKKAQRESRERAKVIKYGITQAVYEAILAEQGGVCVLCESPPKNKALCVDHDHETGKIRGLLCAACNGALGQFGDNAEGILRVLRYLAALPPNSPKG